MRGDDDDDALYVFERGTADRRVPPARRRGEDAAQSLKILKRRLGMAEVLLTADLEKLLLRYCSDTILNILWYDRARKREQRANARRTYLMVVLMIVALLLLCASAFLPSERSTSSGAAMLPFALLAGGALTVLQVVAALADGKARLSIFWKAGADLKEALYRFEHKWRGRVFGGDPPCAAAEFDAAVQEELKFAYAVTRAERLEFFANLRSPSDVFAVAISAVNNLRERRFEGSVALAARDEQLAAARRSVSEARAAVLASQYRLQAATDGTNKSAEETVLVNARAEVVRTEAILHELVGG
jgi:predicted nucleic acid-binding Zn ribbon protein